MTSLRVLPKISLGRVSMLPAGGYSRIRQRPSGRWYGFASRFGLAPFCLPRGRGRSSAMTPDLDDKILANVRDGRIPVGAAREAVKAARAAAPRPGPRPAQIKPRRKPQAQPRRKPRPYWDATHPLAAAARELCTSRQHPVWEQLGKVACGRCWEDTVRADQDKQSAARKDQTLLDAAAS